MRWLPVRACCARPWWAAVGTGPSASCSRSHGGRAEARARAWSRLGYTARRRATPCRARVSATAGWAPHRTRAVPGRPRAGCRIEENTPAHSGSIASTWLRSQMTAGGCSASCLRMARWTCGAAARSSRPARASTTHPWWPDCSIRIAAFRLRPHSGQPSHCGDGLPRASALDRRRPGSPGTVGVGALSLGTRWPIADATSPQTDDVQGQTRCKGCPDGAFGPAPRRRPGPTSMRGGNCR
jgi:hypothetical protein